jgi:predicted pyridoxine 5'-phosphate oxidase superfamily flavin-nucleotide-binding protein
LSADETRFIEARDSFYMATVGETGWPYIQHRGGPAGFVRVLDAHTIGFAEFRGNRQYISVGNLQTDDRVSMFFMDYRRKTRLKLLGRARAVDPEDTDLLNRLSVPGYAARVERGLLVTVEGFDWNCPQHITERFTIEEVRTLSAPLLKRIADLEAQLKSSRGGQHG